TVTVKDTAGLSSTATQTVTASAVSNLVGNPGFETNTNGWNAGGRAGVTVTRVSGAHSGTSAAAITNTNSSAVTECTLNDSPNWVASTTPGTYVGSLWLRADTAGAQIKVRFREYTSSGGSVSSASVTVNLTTSWQLVQVSYPVTHTGDNIDFSAYTSNSPQGVCFYADDVSITRS
ncbi:MAG: carbohydrate binding domain-containing protein, partial [Actinomycetota bacterium]